MAQTQKEILRDTILTQMKPYLDTVVMDMLNQVLIQALFHVDVVEIETLPATRENTNEYILEVYNLKKIPKLSKETAKYYLLTVKNFIQFVNKSLLDVTDMDVEYYLQNYMRSNRRFHIHGFSHIRSIVPFAYQETAPAVPGCL